MTRWLHGVAMGIVLMGTFESAQASVDWAAKAAACRTELAAAVRDIGKPYASPYAYRQPDRRLSAYADALLNVHADGWAPMARMMLAAVNGIRKRRRNAQAVAEWADVMHISASAMREAARRGDAESELRNCWDAAAAARSLRWWVHRPN